MKVLITTSRMPCALDEIRKLGGLGHQVIATDTIWTAPGSHSRLVTKSCVTSSPRFASERFVDEIEELVERESVDLVMPAFEEVFYLAKGCKRLPEHCRFFPSLEVLAKLHDKGRLAEFAREIGVRVPQSSVVTSHAELMRAIASLPRYFAKPVFSRGGVDLLTNSGPLAGAILPDQCEVSRARPWIVQEFVMGLDVCTFSVVHHGKISGHSAYVHPREIEHAGGIVFESVDEPACLAIAQKIAEATGYHGQLSLDFLKSESGMVLIECNPRPTAGVHVMSAESFEQAVMDARASRLRVTPPGARGKYSLALLRDLALHFKEAAEDLRYLLSDAREIVGEGDDFMPAIYQVLSYAELYAQQHQQVHKKKGKRSTALMEAYFADICWNGDDLPASDAREPSAAPAVPRTAES